MTDEPQRRSGMSQVGPVFDGHISRVTEWNGLVVIVTDKGPHWLNAADNCWVPVTPCPMCGSEGQSQ